MPRFGHNQSFVSSSGGSSGSSSALGVGSSSASGVGGNGCCLCALWLTVNCCYFPQLQLLHLFMMPWVIIAFVMGDSSFPLLLPTLVDCFLQILLIVPLCCWQSQTTVLLPTQPSLLLSAPVAVVILCGYHFLLPFCQCQLLFFHGLLLSPPVAVFCLW